MSFKVLFNRLDDAILADKLSVILNYNMDMPWLIKVILDNLSDEMMVTASYSSENFFNLCNLVCTYYDTSWVIYYDIMSGKLKLNDLIKYDKRHCYWIKLVESGAERIATTGEVESAVVQIHGDELIPIYDKPTDQLNEKEYKLINMFNWTLTGLWRYYIRSGYTVKYSKDGKMEEPEIRYIIRQYKVLMRLCELLEDGTCDRVIAHLKKIKSAGVYRYPEYAPDEIVMKDDIGYIINQLMNTRISYKTKTQLECTRILKHINSGKSVYKSKLTVEDRIKLRIAYMEMVYLKSDKSYEARANLEARRQEIMGLCNRVKDGVIAGKLPTDHFSLRIINTIASHDYTRMSDKQKDILLDAIVKIGAVQDVAVQREEVKSADKFGLASLSDMLGSGQFS